MRKIFSYLPLWLILTYIPFIGIAQKEVKTPIVVITDLYHPYQDPGDNLDLIMGFGLPDVELKAVLLDVTDAFRKDTADHPVLWRDPFGPREAGMIPIRQLNYIFNREVPYAIGPLSLMRNEEDKMSYLSPIESGAMNLLKRVLEESDLPIDVLSFGSARILAVAYNRYPGLMKKKIRKIHLSAGTASINHELGKDQGANGIPGGEWNVALDVFAFTRLLRSDLPVAIYPCACKDGGFAKDQNNTYWQLPSVSFIQRMHPQLQRYVDFAFRKRLQYDFLRSMEADYLVEISLEHYPAPFHFWESAIWLEVIDRGIAYVGEAGYKLIKRNGQKTGLRMVDSRLRSCLLTEIREDGRFQFQYTDKASGNKQIYYREDPNENEKALQKVIPDLYVSISPTD